MSTFSIRLKWKSNYYRCLTVPLLIKTHRSCACTLLNTVTGVLNEMVLIHFKPPWCLVSCKINKKMFEIFCPHEANLLTPCDQKSEFMCICTLINIVIITIQICSRVVMLLLVLEFGTPLLRIIELYGRVFVAGRIKCCCSFVLPCLSEVRK